MLYATKIDFSIDPSLLITKNKPFTNIGVVSDVYTLIKRREILNLLPKELRGEALVCLTVMNFNGDTKEAETHIHAKEKCVLNFYIETNEEETSFFEGKEEIIPLRKGISSKIYMVDPNVLTKIESFTAKVGETWLMKTNKPHRVLSIKETGFRKFVQIYFYNLEYEEVLSILKEHYATT